MKESRSEYQIQSTEILTRSIHCVLRVYLEVTVHICDKLKTGYYQSTALGFH